ncbi:MAG TPA: ABC transporter permease [Terriglobales bacterium]|jgi:ABC-2 type transport system permease protein|nr:ABC transporter permease [Terriglobales bacterium]
MTTARPLSATLDIYGKEAYYEFLKYLRIPMYAGSTLVFPIMFYILFGLLMNHGGDVRGMGVSTYLIATYGTFGVMGASLFSNGIGIAVERGLGWMQVKRASPMPPFAYFTAKFFVSAVFSVAIAVVLLSLGWVFGGTHITAFQAAKLLAVLFAGVAPFCALGIAIGYLAGPNSAAAAVNLIYLPLSFASGLWFPVEALPKFLQHLAAYLPPYHLAQLALGVLGGGDAQSPLHHLEFLFGFTLLALGVAFLGYRRDEGKTYG